MQPADVLEKYESTHRTWREALEPLDDAAFARTPPPDGGKWSIGELCDHLGLVSNALLEEAKECAAGRGEERGFQFQPAALCWFGSLPPVRIKVPEVPKAQLLAQVSQLDKATALARLDETLEHMRRLVESVGSASTRCRREHPAGGWMHARQWYQLNEMHYRHHLRQLRRML